jgi:hypothetical protein
MQIRKGTIHTAIAYLERLLCVSHFLLPSLHSMNFNIQIEEWRASTKRSIPIASIDMYSNSIEVFGSRR